jgi:hypothetical protein
MPEIGRAEALARVVTPEIVTERGEAMGWRVPSFFRRSNTKKSWNGI